MAQDAFTTGGAQPSAAASTRPSSNWRSDIDFVRGAHSWRTGVLCKVAGTESDDTIELPGHLTFASLADYQAGKPMSYSRRTGDPNISYSTYPARRSTCRMTTGLPAACCCRGGVRYGIQSQVSDHWNFSPRMSAAWSPFKDGRMTFRGELRVLLRLACERNLDKQTLLVDGFVQRETNHFQPRVSGSRHRWHRRLRRTVTSWSDALGLPNAHRVSPGRRLRRFRRTDAST